MAETIRGTLAVVWALNSVLGPLTGSGSWTTQNTRFSKEADITPLKNARGATASEIYSDQREMLTLDLVVTGDTVAHAKTSNVLPAPGDIMDITDSSDPQIATAGGTPTDTKKYLFQTGEKTAENTNFVKFSVTVKRYKDNDVATAIS